MCEKKHQNTAVDRIHEFLRFGSKLGLERMETLMDKLGHPEMSYKVVHIAGTNGKGSTAKFIYESLIEAGYKAGIYTSPYIEVFNERIEFMREYISDEDLESCTDIVLGKVNEMIEEGSESPTEFEVVTAICLLYFEKIGCEIAVLEVGLGGKGDSTNIVEKPLCSVITSISYDHMDRLGSTIEEIAEEKAGIIKAGSPALVSTERKEALKVFLNKAASVGAPLYDAREMAEVIVKETSPEGSVFDVKLKPHAIVTSDYDPKKEKGAGASGDVPSALAVDCKAYELSNVSIGMGGEHQVTNAVEAIAALYVIREHGVDIPRRKRHEVDARDSAKQGNDLSWCNQSIGLDQSICSVIKKGLARAKVPGRFEVVYGPGAACSNLGSVAGDAAGQELSLKGDEIITYNNDHPWVIMDGAHNKDGAAKLRLTMEKVFPNAKILVVTGVLSDKDVNGILEELTAFGDTFIATEPNNSRKLPAHVLAKKVHDVGKMVYEIPKPCDAVALAMSEGRGFDVVLFSGSLYLIGEVRQMLKENYLNKNYICFDEEDKDDDF